jgi:signal transduction histidine kinase
MRIASVGAVVGSRLGTWFGFSAQPGATRIWQALAGHAAGLAATLAATWRSLDLLRRFAIVAAVSAAVFAATSSYWISDRIERSLMHDRTQAVRMLAREVVGPLVQTLSVTGKLEPDPAAAFDGLLSASAGQVAAMRIRRHDGTLVYASDGPDAGSIGEPEQQPGVDLFETTVPLYKSGTHELVAVAQMYGIANGAPVDWARVQTWLVMVLLALALLALPFKVVESAAAQIARQKRHIAAHKSHEARLLARTEALRKLADMVHRRGQEQNERMLRRIGSDLHDGPAQHLALVLLRLDELAPPSDRQGAAASGSSPNVLQTIRRATADALKEIRHISAGLALPELQKISLADALRIAVRAHQRATNTRVEATLGELPARVPLPITICLYRFAQEALNNAFRHADGAGQTVSASYDGTSIVVEVADSGPGFVVERAVTGGERLGLSGLRYRVESLGGTLEINSALGQGSRLTVRFSKPLG